MAIFFIGKDFYFSKAFIFILVVISVVTLFVIWYFLSFLSFGKV